MNKSNLIIQIDNKRGIDLNVDRCKTVSGAMVLENKVYSDHRGWFQESFNFEAFASIGLVINVAQINHSHSSTKGTIRGLHFQVEPYSQGKLVRCLKGSIYDVVADIDPSSPTFLGYFGVELSPENNKMLWIPQNCAHGFQCLDDDTEVEYLTTSAYNKDAERCLAWNDPDLGIEWPLELSKISEKDNLAINLRDFLGF